MASSSVRTILPLDTFFKTLSFSPILGNQVSLPADMQQTSACAIAILQYTWSSRNGGSPGREEMAEAIAQAEGLIMQHAGFAPAPTWFKNERVLLPNESPGTKGAFGGLRGGSIWSIGARAGGPAPNRAVLKNKYVIQGGIEAWSLIEASAPVTYTDVNSDGWKEKASVTVNTTITDVNQIAVYYPGMSHDPAWEIRPIQVSISGGVATITFNREQAVLPDLLTRLDAEAVAGEDDANFLTTVDVYRHYNDPSQMGRVEWENGQWCDATACRVDYQNGCLSVIDGPSGVVSIHGGTYDAATEEWTHAWPAWWGRPDRFVAWYRAGYENSNLARPMCDMDPEMARAISLLALSLMDRQWENCEQLHNLQTHWRTDLAIRESSPATSISFNLSRQLLENPFGTTRAAVYAWRVVQRLIVGEAVSVG